MSRQKRRRTQEAIDYLDLLDEHSSTSDELSSGQSLQYESPHPVVTVNDTTNKSMMPRLSISSPVHPNAGNLSSVDGQDHAEYLSYSGGNEVLPSLSSHIHFHYVV